MYQLALIEIDRMLLSAYNEEMQISGVRPSDLDKMEKYAKKHGLKVR